MIRKLCVVIAAIAALAMPSTAVARTLDVDPQRVEFGAQPWNSFTKRAFETRNAAKNPVVVSVEPGFVPDDFSPGQPESTCPLTSSTTLAPGETCVHVIGYYADPAQPFQGRRRMELQVVGRDPNGTELDRRSVTVTAMGTDHVIDAPDGVSFGRQKFETFETRTFTVSNTTEHTITLTTDIGLPDDFSHLIDSTCGLGDHVLGPHESCTEVIGFRPTPFFAGLETATVVLTARGPSGLVWETRTVTITGRGV